MRSLLLVFGLLATPAVAAEQFDLVCTAKHDKARYRVDLARGEWCQDACKETSQIARVTPATIVLYQKDRAFERDDTALKSIDRVTGEWTDLYTGGQYSSWAIKGKCVPATFSGFPAPTRQF